MITEALGNTGGGLPKALKAFKSLERLKGLGGAETLTRLKTLVTGMEDRPLLGVDIAPGSVRVVQMGSATALSAKTAPRYRLEGYVIRPLPAGAVVERDVSDVAAVGEAVGEAVAALGSGVNEAAVAVAGPSVSTKVIQMDGTLKDAELEERILQEAGRHIPYRPEDVVMDFERRGRVAGPGSRSAVGTGAGARSGGDRGLVEVLLAACRREAVEARVAALELGGLTVKVVDIEMFVLERVFPLLLEDTDGSVAVIDMAPAMTALTVLQDGRALYTRDQPFDGPGYGPDDPAGMAQHIRQCLQSFYESGPYDEVEQLLLAGDLRHTAMEIEAALGIPTSPADPFTACELGPGVARADLQRDAPALLVACGLAMRRAP